MKQEKKQRELIQNIAKIVVFGALILTPFLISGCEQSCKSNLYTAEGKCCNYVCNVECEHGYKQNTCNCECLENAYAEDNSTNIDDIFSEEDVTPPAIPG